MRRFVGVTAWTAGASVLLASGAWLFSGYGWRIDLVANLTAQIGVLCLALLIASALLRRWWLLSLVSVAAILQIAALAPGRAPGGSGADDDIVRIMTFNTYNRGHSGSGPTEIIETVDVDVMTLIEPTPDVVRLIRNSEPFKARFPHLLPARPYANRPTIVSRWPIEYIKLRYGAVTEGAPNPGMSPTGAIIQRPGGAFILIAVHPPSPRSREAWENGNESIRRLSTMIVDLTEKHGLPVVVGGDFNSTPTGWRSRALRSRTGLRRGKPWLTPVGSWPGGMVWPARLAIDDVYVSPSIRVASWETLPGFQGGDHSPVRVELLIPPAKRTPPANQDSQSKPQ